LIIRHAEKPNDGIHLNTRGWERAYALVPFFSERDEFIVYGKPYAIYAMGQNRENSSVRPIETVQLLASTLNIPLITSFKHFEYKEMVDEILNRPDYEGKSILISWEHKSINDIAKALGVKGELKKWKGAIYDRVYKLTFKNGEVKFEDLPQRLLFGDSES
ncbi:MAG: hypothetical protein ACK4HV_01280, partial [Parachlamydiaceae bacterium]